MPERRMPPAPWQKKGKRSPVRKAPSPKIEKYPASPTQIPTKLRLMAIDPGITTGMAFRIDGKLATCVGYSDEDVIDLIHDLDVVVIERFATAGRLSAPGLLTIELVGQVRGWCRAQGIRCDVATPQARYMYMQEAYNNIGRGKLIEPSKVQQHERDALAHLLSWEYRNR